MSSFLTKAQMLAQAAPQQAMPLVPVAPSEDWSGSAGYAPPSPSYSTQAAPQAQMAPEDQQASPIQSQAFLGSEIQDSRDLARQDMRTGQRNNKAAADEFDKSAKLTRDTAKAKSNEMAGPWADVAAATKTYMQTTQEIAAKAEMDTAKQMQKLQAATQDAANTRINNWWSEAPTSAKVLGVISQLFGGAANGLAGNPGAPTALDRVIAQDIQRQTLNLNQKNQNAQNQKSLLAQMYEQTGNLQAAQAAVYQTAIKSADARMKVIANRMATPEAEAAYQAAHAEFMVKLNNSNQAMAQQYHTQNTQALGQLVGLEGMKERLQAAHFKAAEDDKVMQRKKVEHINAVKESVALIDALVSGTAASNQSTQAQLIQSANKALTGSNRAPSVTEKELLRDAQAGFRIGIPSVTGTYQSVNKAALNALRERLLKSVDEHAETTGTETSDDLQGGNE